MRDISTKPLFEPVQDSPTTLVDLLRHGEPAGGRKYRGGSDDPLSEEGWRQMRTAVDGPQPWQQIIASPLLRCRDFAEELADKSQTPITIEPRLREIGFGHWEGKSAEEITADDPDALHRFYRDPLAYQPAGAEPPRTFLMRISKALEEAVEQHPGQHLLIVGHAGVIRAAIAHLLDIPLHRLFQIKTEYAHFTRLQFGGQRPPSLIFHNMDKLPGYSDQGS
jgi:alpha-ribazole phosphatase/probable phosphoglycerate mutase